MPFKSDAQRRLFYAAEKSPEIRKRKGLSLATVHEFIMKSHHEKLGTGSRRKK